MWKLLIFLTVLKLSVQQEGSIPPFCGLCECLVNQGSSDYKVTCRQEIKAYLFNTYYYFDNKTNSSWPIQELSVQFTSILFLDKQFPESGLKILDLSNNSIVNVSDSVFSNLQSMETLILSDNGIELLHPDAFKGQFQEGDYMPLRSLRTLKLDHNRIHSLDGDIFEHTSSIEVLSLAYNPIGIIDHQTTIAITSLAYLKELDLSYTGIKALPDYFLHTPKYLRTLDLGGNLFEAVPKQLEEAHNLESLCLSSNPIANITQKTGFPVIKTLKILHMCQMPNLTTVGPHSLSNLRNLTELYIGDNLKLNYIDANALSDRFDAEYETWPPIKKLYLANNQLTHIDMHLLQKWDSLTELDLRGNVWTCECKNQWIVDELIPIYIKIDEYEAKLMKCAAPIEMAEFTFYDIYVKESNMRCLDYYGNHPEKDGPLLVGLLAGLLLTIPTILFLLYAYQRHWFGLFDSSPAAYSRQFYHKTRSNDDVLN